MEWTSILMGGRTAGRWSMPDGTQRYSGWAERVRSLLDRLPGSRERRWVAAAREEFRFLADLGMTETELKYSVTGPMLTFEGDGTGVTVCWEADGIGELTGMAWRDSERDTEVMLSRLIRSRMPDAPLPPAELRDIDEALTATRVFARQVAEAMPAFLTGD